MNAPSTETEWDIGQPKKKEWGGLIFIRTPYGHSRYPLPADSGGTGTGIPVVQMQAGIMQAGIMQA